MASLLVDSGSRKPYHAAARGTVGGLWLEGETDCVDWGIRSFRMPERVHRQAREAPVIDHRLEHELGSITTDAELLLG